MAKVKVDTYNIQDGLVEDTVEINCMQDFVSLRSVVNQGIRGVINGIDVMKDGTLALFMYNQADEFLDFLLGNTKEFYVKS